MHLQGEEGTAGEARPQDVGPESRPLPLHLECATIPATPPLRPLTLRTRLTLLTFGVLLCTLLAFAGVAGVVLWQVELRSVARQVASQADALLAVVQSTPSQLDDIGDDILEESGITASARVYVDGQLRWAGGASGPDTLDPEFLKGSGPAWARQVGGYQVISRRGGMVVVQVGRNLLPLKHLMQRYASVAAMTLLLLSVLGGWLVAREVRRALRPLEALARRVGHLDGPGPLPGLEERDEVGALARALAESLRALRAERERETLFLASASHELRTPVTAMLADLQHTLSRERPPEEWHAALERTERTAGRLRQLTGNLMTLTRAQRLLPLGPSRGPTVDLLTLAGEAVDLLQPLAMRRDLDLWLDGASAPVRGDSTLLSSVLENLIGNAVKFTPPGGRVLVDVSAQPGGGAALRVEDTGPGFPGGVLTDAFVRGLTEVEGFGLGLAVVRRVVEVHGGTLHLGRAEGGGARVDVTLPGEEAISPLTNF
ncbi:HAMP domain-containing protein [Deinococcus hopiensis KR-140]|uniref:histidine kinase n=1 Tax=Deinococcus hopiensis KR-140 TaxID=695939 RepID=A0A1W1USM2_9DEIO|nr:HAMP domain-containing protein [Deinococcus hopiensis KR-140]